MESTEKETVDVRYLLDKDVHAKIVKHQALMRYHLDRYVTMEESINDFIRQAKQPKSVGELKAA